MNALLVALAVLGAADELAHPRQLRIDVCVVKGDPLGSRADGTVKVLAEPSLICMNRQTACFMSGSTSFGVKLAFSPKLEADGTVRLAVTTDFTTPRPAGAKLGNGQTATAFDVRTWQHERVVKPGEKVRFRLAADSPESQLWAEIMVRPEPRGK